MISEVNKGEVVYVDNLGTVHIKWDNGSTLGMVPGKDKWIEEVPA